MGKGSLVFRVMDGVKKSMSWARDIVGQDVTCQE